MRLVTFADATGTRPQLGALCGESIVALAGLATAAGVRLPETMRELIHADPATQLLARTILHDSPPRLIERFSRPLGRIRLLAPLPRPGKILCSGINYHGHLQENPAAKLPDEPFFFAKMPSAVIGPDAPIRLPSRSQQIDYEVEFAAVIGRTLMHASQSEILTAIFGYTILHDVSARDVQFKDNQITLGKNFDSFCPMGPCIVTADEIPHPETLTLQTRVNGELRQNGTNRDWVFPLERLLSDLSQVMTLEPGDIVSTGTPTGVGLFRRPPTFLKDGDVVELEIEGIGILRNPVVAARSATDRS